MYLFGFRIQRKTGLQGLRNNILRVFVPIGFPTRTEMLGTNGLFTKRPINKYSVEAKSRDIGDELCTGRHTNLVTYDFKLFTLSS